MKNADIFKKCSNKMAEKFRSCANCGHVLTIKNTMLCNFCYESLLRSKFNKGQNLIYNSDLIPTFSLFQWVPQQNNALSSLMLGLKGSTAENIWDHYAGLFLNYRLSLADFPYDAILIPCPGLCEEKDHASLFAEAISRRTKMPVQHIFKRADLLHFREQSKQTRELNILNRLKFSENITQNEMTGKKVIFVDDVMTTGSTVKSASLLLSKASALEAWTIAFRTL